MYSTYCVTGHTFAAVARMCEAPEVFRTVVAVDRLRKTLLDKAEKIEIGEDGIQVVGVHLWPWCRVVAFGLTTSSPTFPESKRDSVSCSTVLYSVELFNMSI